MGAQLSGSCCYKSQLDDKPLEGNVVPMVLFCTAEYGKLNPHDWDSLAAKVQIIYKVPEIKEEGISDVRLVKNYEQSEVLLYM